jgi:hypothetical protein
VREHSIAQRSIRQFPHHRGLDYREDLARMWCYCREAEDFIAVAADERFHETARFRQCTGAKHCLHGQLRHAVGAARRHRFVFIESDSRYFRIRKKTERDQAVARVSRATVKVSLDNAEVVLRYVRELRAACAFA